MNETSGDSGTPLSPRRVEQWAELRVYADAPDGDFDPDELTRRLDVEPTRRCRRGEVLRSGRVRGHSSWWWKTEERVTFDSESVVIEVLDHFEPGPS